MLAGVLFLDPDARQYLWQMRIRGCDHHLLYLFSASSALFDLTVGLLPILLVRNLQMNQRTKIAVAGLLGMACMYVNCTFT